MPQIGSDLFALDQTCRRNRQSPRSAASLRQRKDWPERLVKTDGEQVNGMKIESDTLVDDVMRQTPATIRVFLDFRMKCVGCPIACFHTVEDACREHGIEMARFLAALQKCKSSTESICAADPVGT